MSFALIHTFCKRISYKFEWLYLKFSNNIFKILPCSSKEIVYKHINPFKMFGEESSSDFDYMPEMLEVFKNSFWFSQLIQQNPLAHLQVYIIFRFFPFPALLPYQNYIKFSPERLVWTTNPSYSAHRTPRFSPQTWVKVRWSSRGSWSHTAGKHKFGIQNGSRLA